MLFNNIFFFQDATEGEKNEERVEPNEGKNANAVMKKRGRKKKTEKQETFLPDALKINRYVKSGISKSVIFLAYLPLFFFRH